MPNMDDLLGSLDDQAEEKQDQQDKAEQLDAVKSSGDKVARAVNTNTQSTAEGLKDIKGEVKVTNPTDVSGVVDSINKLNLTAFMQNEGLPQLAKNLSDLSGKTQDLQDKLENEGLKKMGDQLGLVVKKLDEVGKTLSKTEVSVDAKLQKTIDNLSKSINAIDFKPSVSVSAPQTKVVTTPVDFKPVLSALAGVEQAIKDSEVPETEIDLSAVTSGLSSVQDAITALRFPVPNYVLPFRNSQGKADQVQLSPTGGMPVVNPDGTTISGGGGGGGASTIADGADVTQGALADAAVTAGSTGSVSGKLRQISSNISSVDTKTPALGQALAAGSVPVILPSATITTLTPPAAITGFALDSSLTTIDTDIKSNITLHAGSNVIGGVTIADGSVTTLGAKADAKSAATDTTPISAISILKQISASVQAPPSQAVTNTGTFAVQATMTSTTITGTVAVTESGTWNVGSSSATGTAVPANAFYNGVNAQTALPTAASAGNLTGVTADKFGRTVVLSGTIRDLVGTQTTTITASTAETTIVTAAASTFNDLYFLTVANTSATATRVDFRDTTAGSILFSWYIPAGDMRGGSLAKILPQTTVNTNWTIQSSASITDLRVYAVWEKNK